MSSSANRSSIAKDISASKKLAFCEEIPLFESRDDSRSIHVRKTTAGWNLNDYPLEVIPLEPFYKSDRNLEVKLEITRQSLIKVWLFERLEEAKKQNSLGGAAVAGSIGAYLAAMGRHEGVYFSGPYIGCPATKEEAEEAEQTAKWFFSPIAKEQRGSR
jgi:hypothetical protein